jgi:SHS2 domain-containing protein
MAYEFLDHTADIKIRASGSDLAGALCEAARALTEAIAGDSEIGDSVEKSFEIKIHKPQILVHDFLAQIIYYFATEELLFSRFDVEIKEAMGYKLTARLFGEKYDPKKHKPAKEIKAVTYHEMIVKQEDGKHILEVLFDA